MRKVFAALGKYDVDGIMVHWGENCSYDNPMVGPAALGKSAVREQMKVLTGILRDRGAHLEIDRATEAPGRVVLEWHVEPGDGTRRGVHVAEVDEDNLVRAVTVYPRD